MGDKDEADWFTRNADRRNPEAHINRDAAYFGSECADAIMNGTLVRSSPIGNELAADLQAKMIEAGTAPAVLIPNDLANRILSSLTKPVCLEGLVEALKPLAAIADEFTEWNDDVGGDEITLGDWDCGNRITIGDCRRAREILAALTRSPITDDGLTGEEVVERVARAIKELWFGVHLPKDAPGFGAMARAALASLPDGCRGE